MTVILKQIMTTTNLLHTYQNGNYSVSIFDDGTKIRESESGEFRPDFPESIDLKITNQCNLSSLCTYCHEQSNINGKHAPIDRILKFVDGLPAGVEIAIGGGNPLSHPDLDSLLAQLDKRGLIANITINQEHIERYQIPSKVKGIGISFRRRRVIPKIKAMTHVIHHMILGVHAWNDFVWLCQSYYAPKILWLGFKSVGNGAKFKLENNDINDKIQLVKEHLNEILNYTNLVAFDNLAIAQLSPHEIFTKGDFMGDDGEYSFYYDAVEDVYSIGSSYNERKPLAGKNAQQIFKLLNQGEFTL